ncbi:MAG TPA: DUF1559 domain-containing protein [Pirellulales bacterium]|nr:DUF1559 domain-containing protein [Pirellulales bacterium]
MRPNSSPSGRPRESLRHGFTLVELLVVITIIGVLMALLIPVIGRVREMAHRVACMNNEKEIGLAMTLYATSKGKMPPYMTTFADPLSSPAGTNYTLGWAENLMGQLGSPSFAPGTLPVATLRASLPEVALLVCPSDPTKVGQKGVGPLSYVVNGGCPYSSSATPVDWNQNGAWNYFAGSTTTNTNRTLEYIGKHDGASTTISLSENLDAVSYSFGSVTAASGSVQQTVSSQCLLWYPGQTSGAAPINWYPGSGSYPSGTIDSGGGQGNTQLARPSSNHPGGAVFGFCDGSVKFIQQTVTYNVYATLMTSYGAQASPPGTAFTAGNSYYGTQVIPLDMSQVPTN